MTHVFFSLPLVSAYLRAGEVQTGLAVVGDLLAHVEHTGDGRLEEPLLWLSRGELLLATGNGDENEAEISMQRALTIAGRQHAKLPELVTATALAKLWQRQGKREAALKLLEPIYAWFTEGFEYPELKNARVLLGELANPVEGRSCP
jgi:hypothetical protein